MAQSRSYAEHIATQDWDRAERALRKAAKAKAPGADIFYNLAKVLEAAGKPGQMRIWLKRAVAAKPDYAIAWFELGRVELRDHQLAQALNAFEQARAHAPQDKDARRNAARIALRLGLWDKAEAGFQGDADFEAQAARYRIAAETGTATAEQRDALLRVAGHRPMAIKALTRTARGSIGLTPQDWPSA